MVKVSIIVPYYNTKKYLKKCLDSLLNQTLYEIEILLINDGCNEKIDDILSLYSDDRIKYINNSHGGIGKTRNTGIELAQGEYLMFIDSDDYVSLNMVEKLYDKAKKENLDMVLCNYFEDRDGDIINKKIASFKNTTIYESSYIINNINLAPWNKLYKRKMIVDNKIKFIENLKYEDAPFAVESLLCSKRIGKVEEYLPYYVIREKSETTTKDKNMIDIISILKIINKELELHNFDENEKNDLLVSTLIPYMIDQKYVKNRNVRNKFLDESYDFLNKYTINWKKSSFFENDSKIKRIIKTNKVLIKFYVNVANLYYKFAIHN